jgi:hypothetical protein
MPPIEVGYSSCGFAIIQVGQLPFNTVLPPPKLMHEGVPQAPRRWILVEETLR